MVAGTGGAAVTNDGVGHALESLVLCTCTKLASSPKRFGIGSPGAGCFGLGNSNVVNSPPPPWPEVKVPGDDPFGDEGRGGLAPWGICCDFGAAFGFAGESDDEVLFDGAAGDTREGDSEWELST